MKADSIGRMASEFVHGQADEGPRGRGKGKGRSRREREAAENRDQDTVELSDEALARFEAMEHELSQRGSHQASDKPLP